MNVSPVEARKTLDEVEALSNATRMVAEFTGTDIVVMAWGGVWFLGFLWSHLVEANTWPNILHGVWFPLVAAGVLFTIFTERRRGAPVKNATGRRIGFFWWTMYGYAYLGLAILGAQMDDSLLVRTHDSARAIAALNTIIPMFAYVVMGLWLEQDHFIFMGLSLTVLTCVAYFLLNPAFFLVMSLAGGGILFGYGVWMRMRWSRAMAEVKKHAHS